LLLKNAMVAMVSQLPPGSVGMRANTARESLQELVLCDVNALPIG
jgi:hypothetical protein